MVCESSPIPQSPSLTASSSPRNCRYFLDSQFPARCRWCTRVSCSRSSSSVFLHHVCLVLPCTMPFSATGSITERKDSLLFVTRLFLYSGARVTHHHRENHRLGSKRRLFTFSHPPNHSIVFICELAPDSLPTASSNLKWALRVSPTVFSVVCSPLIFRRFCIHRRGTGQSRSFGRRRVPWSFCAFIPHLPSPS
jgi:hypothetical protein